MPLRFPYRPRSRQGSSKIGMVIIGGVALAVAISSPEAIGRAIAWFPAQAKDAISESMGHGPADGKRETRPVIDFEGKNSTQGQGGTRAQTPAAKRKAAQRRQAAKRKAAAARDAQSTQAP